MLEHIPAGIDPKSYKSEMQIEENRDAVHLHAADEHAAIVEAVASYVKTIITKYGDDVRSTDVSYSIQSESFGVGALILSVPEEAPALPKLVTELIEPFRGDEYIELRAEGYNISPNYGMQGDGYKYVFHYGG